MEISSLPKIELHVHLDCSLSFEVLQKLDPTITAADFKSQFTIPEKCKDLKEYIDIASRSLALMQTRENLEVICLDLARQFAKDNVIYAEVRYAPLQHTEGGLTAEEVVDTINKAFQKGKEVFGVDIGIILCTLRHYSEQQSMATVQLVQTFKGSITVGLDIAADEAGHPLDAHVAAFKFAHKNGIPCTAHAGEAAGHESVIETLDVLKPTRIGHGIRSIESEALIERLIGEKIHLEICPSSNVKLSVVDSMKDHPVDALFNKGVSLSLSCDGRNTLTDSLKNEYQLLIDSFGWEKSHLLKCNLEALKYAFASDDLKARLYDKIVKGFWKPAKETTEM